MTNIIHEAAKTGLVIPTERGMRNVVELYKLPLTGGYSLDSISREFLARINQRKQESLVVSDADSLSPLDQLRLDVLKQVIADVKEAEKEAEEARAKELGKSARRQELLARKVEIQKESTRSMTQEEVDAELAALDAEEG